MLHQIQKAIFVLGQVTAADDGILLNEETVQPVSVLKGIPSFLKVECEGKPGPCNIIISYKPVEGAKGLQLLKGVKARDLMVYGSFKITKPSESNFKEEF